MTDFTKAAKFRKGSTEVRVAEKELQVKLYRTRIVSVLVSGNHAEVTLANGGYRTKTTLRRLNEVADHYQLPFVIESHEEWGWVIAMKNGGFLPFDEESKTFTTRF